MNGTKPLAGAEEHWTPPATERDARLELAIAYRAAALYGWTDLGATHFSCRVPGEPDAYLMLRSGSFFDEVTASDLIKVGMDGRVRGPGAANPAATTIHGALLNERVGLGSVMHTHTTAGVAVCCNPAGLLPLSQHALRFWGRQGRHRYEGVALEADEGPRLVADLADFELLLLENHGLLTVGPNVPAAFSALYYAETSCRMQVDTLASVQNPILVSDDVCARTAKQYEASDGYMYRDWLGIRRQVLREVPEVVL